MIKDPHAQLDEKEKENLEKIRDWFKTYATIKDGYVQTKTTGGGFMTSHNWDGVTYDPNIKQILHAAGHIKEDDWKCYFLLLGEYTPDTFHEKLAEFQKTLKPSTSNMWVFDFADDRWRKAYHDGPRVPTQQGGAFMKYIPELKKSIYYHAHGNRPMMMFYDGVNNTWSPVNPNGGAPLRKLVHDEEVAPLQEQQVAYSSKHRKLVAVIDTHTHVYDIDKNEWSRLPGERPLKAHDANTIFDYDSNSDTFILLSSGRKQGEGAMVGMSLTDGKWNKITPQGASLPFAQWSCGEGFYHPEHNVFVCHTPNKIWVYRHQATQNPDVVERIEKLMAGAAIPSRCYPIGKLYNGQSGWTQIH